MIMRKMAVVVVSSALFVTGCNKNSDQSGGGRAKSSTRSDGPSFASSAGADPRLSLTVYQVAVGVLAEHGAGQFLEDVLEFRVLLR